MNKTALKEFADSLPLNIQYEIAQAIEDYIESNEESSLTTLPKEGKIIIEEIRDFLNANADSLNTHPGFLSNRKENE